MSWLDAAAFHGCFYVVFDLGALVSFLCFVWLRHSKDATLWFRWAVLLALMALASKASAIDLRLRELLDRSDKQVQENRL